MRVRRSARIPVDKAFSVLRKGEDGSKADAVFLCRCYLQEDGSWETVPIFRHWIKNLPEEERNSLPRGIAGAIIAAVTSKPLQKQVGRMLSTAAKSILAPHVGEGASELVSNIIENFTRKED